MKKNNSAYQHFRQSQHAQESFLEFGARLHEALLNGSGLHRVHVVHDEIVLEENQRQVLAQKKFEELNKPLDENNNRPSRIPRASKRKKGNY